MTDFDEEEPAHGFKGVIATIMLGEFGSVFGEVIEPFDVSLVQEPILIAAVAPFGEVLVGDGLVIEFIGQQFFGFGEGVEPFEEFGALFAVCEALI